MDRCHCGHPSRQIRSVSSSPMNGRSDPLPSFLGVPDRPVKGSLSSEEQNRKRAIRKEWHCISCRGFIGCAMMYSSSAAGVRMQVQVGGRGSLGCPTSTMATALQARARFSTARATQKHVRQGSNKAWKDARPRARIHGVRCSAGGKEEEVRTKDGPRGTTKWRNCRCKAWMNPKREEEGAERCSKGVYDGRS